MVVDSLHNQERAVESFLGTGEIAYAFDGMAC
jgi:hypothetical protein